jgi:hypothetical protein
MLMADGFDTRELDKFTQKMVNLANDTMPKESKKFMKKEGNKLNKLNKATFKSKGIGYHTGNLLKGFKSGKVYKYDGSWSVRAYNSSPHAHLLEDGWMWTPNKKQSGTEKFIPGFNFIEDAKKKFESGYYQDVQDFIDEVLGKGL